MIAHNGRLKIAIQKNGRLTEDSLALLRACGLEFEFQKQSLYSPCKNFDLDVLALRDDDIPEYVQDGVADLGIVGENVVKEKQARVRTLVNLGFGGCRLMMSVPQRSSIKSIRNLRGKRIATTYPITLGQFLRANKISAEIIELSGAVELAPTLDVADAICDIVSTGTTARVNGLRSLSTVLESQAVLIANKAILKDTGKKALVDRLLIRISGSLQAHGKRYMMMNAPVNAVPQLKRIIPSLKSPTIVPLAEEGMVALHSVIAEDVFWDVMEKLKRAGASDIIVVPIETIIK
ncbi:MAG: ATP phosphoribosyltransferase [Ignavibacteriales bacterium]|nr:ATP phosphoribosyltransferase [Ignavibacteriales bacterium]